VGLKLNATQVKTIKDLINNPKRKLTYKQLAAKYKVSEMTLYRIKSGENWGRIK
jgi:DNA-binding Xre family transcriptional regulator